MTLKFLPWRQTGKKNKISILKKKQFLNDRSHSILNLQRVFYACILSVFVSGLIDIPAHQK